MCIRDSVYTIVKNDVNKYITNEDIEEIISDVFIALWKNKENLPDTTNLKMCIRDRLMIIQTH